MDKHSIISALDDYADRGLSNIGDLRPSVLGRAGNLSVPPSRRRLGPAPKALALSGLALALLLAGAVVFAGVLEQTKPVSAAEILARSEAAAQPGSPGAVLSTHALVSVKVRNSAADPFYEYQSEWWDQAPDKSRTEATLSTPDGKSSLLILGTVGTTSYRYSIGGGNGEFPIYEKSYVATSVGTNLADAMRQVSGVGTAPDVYDAVLAGTEQVAGRAAYVLNLTLKAAAQPGAPTQVRKRVWIDREAYVVLREQAWDKSGGLIYEMTCRSIEIDPHLDGSLFEFKPPADSIVMDFRPATKAEVDKGWKDAAAQLRTPLFRGPEANYPNWHAGRPYYAPSQGTVTQVFTDDPSGHAHNGSSPSMLISEGPSATLSRRVQDMGNGIPVQVGSLQGRMYRQGQACALAFDRAGTHIIIYVPSGASTIQSTLIPFAEAMQQVAEK